MKIKTLISFTFKCLRATCLLMMGEIKNVNSRYLQENTCTD